MSADIAAQSNTLAKDHHEEVSTGDIAIGVIIGRTSESFDFFVYAIASVLVFPQLCFPYADPLTGTLYCFGIFALAFISRPIGTMIFMTIERKFGRSTKMTLALFLLGTTTVCIGFLPGYATIGHASAFLLAVIRFTQGLAVGGTWDGLPSLLAMKAPKGRSGWYAMIPQLGSPLGLIVASALFAFLLASLAADDFIDWGWRYPFFVAFAINVVALFARLRFVVTPEMEKLYEDKQLEAAPVLDTVKAEGGDIIIGVFAPLASFAMFHMVTVFPLSWVFLYTHQPPLRFLVIEIIGALVGVVACVLSGPLADRFGRRQLLGAMAVAIAIFSGYAPQFLNGGDLGEAVFMILGFGILGLSFGQSSGATASRYAPQYRYTASALTADLAWLCGAGFAPLVALGLSSRFGLPSSGAYLLSGALCTMVALYAFWHEDAQS